MSPRYPARAVAMRRIPSLVGDGASPVTVSPIPRLTLHVSTGMRRRSLQTIVFFSFPITACFSFFFFFTTVSLRQVVTTVCSPIIGKLERIHLPAPHTPRAYNSSAGRHLYTFDQRQNDDIQTSNLILPRLDRRRLKSQSNKTRPFAIVPREIKARRVTITRRVAY